MNATWECDSIISMSKGLGYTVPGPIEANIFEMREVQTSLKGTPMLGFLGMFSVNFEIPEYWGGVEGIWDGEKNHIHSPYSRDLGERIEVEPLLRVNLYDG
jgi:hypothetical protein